MNNFEKFLIEVLMEATQDRLHDFSRRTGKDKAPEEEIGAQQRRITNHFKSVLDDPNASKEDKRIAKNYFDKGPNWREQDPT